MVLEVTRYIYMITVVTFTGLQISNYYYLTSSLKTKNASLVQYALRQSPWLDYPTAVGIIVIYATCFIMVWHIGERSYTEPWIQAACILLTVVSIFFFSLIYIKKINMTGESSFKGYKSMHFFSIGIIFTLILIIRRRCITVHSIPWRFIMKNVLVTGASGFIAREIICKLMAKDINVIACARDTAFVERIFPGITCIKTDFLKETDTKNWIPRLNNIDAVINCVGVFQTRKKNDSQIIHYEAPKALFDACLKTGVKKIIHISALGIESAEIAYASTKRKAEDYLSGLSIDSSIIRPSLVYGRGSYGGSSLFRGFCGLPWILPLPGKAEQLFQPIHLEDLSRIIIESLNIPGKQILCAVGSETVSLKTILNNIRRWLGFKKAFNLHVPMPLIKLGAFLGDFMKDAPINSTGITLMQKDNVASPAEIKTLYKAISFKPRGFKTALFQTTAQVQDRWHARLYFLKPLLRYSIAFVWFWTAFSTLFIYPQSNSYSLLDSAHIPTTVQPFFLYGGCVLDFVLGYVTLFKVRLKLTGTLQLATIGIYTLIITFFLSEFWFHPFGPISKNLPLMVAIGIMIAIESDR